MQRARTTHTHTHTPLRFVQEQVATTRPQLRRLCQPPLLSHCGCCIATVRILSRAPARCQTDRCFGRPGKIAAVGRWTGPLLSMSHAWGCAHTPSFLQSRYVFVLAVLSISCSPRPLGAQQCLTVGRTALQAGLCRDLCTKWTQRA